MKKTFIMAVNLDHRKQAAPQVQDILTDNGRMISLRCGTHETGEDNGLIILKLKGARDKIQYMNDNLNDIDGVSCKYMEL